MSAFDKIIVTFLPLVPKPIVRIFSKPYIAGANLSAAIKRVKHLNEIGCMTTLDILGESAKNQNECQEAVLFYFDLLEVIQQEKLDGNISVKLTQLGLSLDKNLCYENIKKIAQKAATYNIFMRIDMEDASTTDDTIEIFQRINKEFPNTGIVIQAYLRRSLDDITILAAQKTNFRICKGIYIEPRKLAYKDPQIVNNNYVACCEKILSQKCYVGFATHDERLVWQAFRLINKYNLHKNEYEFQMLLGVDEQLRDIIIAAGHRLRVYVPYGKKWHAYSMRRLKENPKIATYVLKSIFKL